MIDFNSKPIFIGKKIIYIIGIILVVSGLWSGDDAVMIKLILGGTYFLVVYNMINNVRLKQRITKLENKIKENNDNKKL